LALELAPIALAILFFYSFTQALYELVPSFFWEVALGNFSCRCLDWPVTGGLDWPHPDSFVPR